MKTIKIIFLLAALMTWATLENLNIYFFMSFAVMMVSGMIWSVMMERKEMK